VATSGESLAKDFFPGTGRSYDRVVRWTTFGRDAAWKRRMIEMLPPCRSILELACGTGILTRKLLDAHPAARLVGVDLTDDYLAVARERIGALGRDVRFLLGDASRVPLAEHGPFDAVVTCYVPKYVEAERLVANVTPSLAPGAIAIFHDFSLPSRWFARTVWRAWFVVLNAVTPWLHPEWRKTFDTRLTQLIRESTWVKDFRASLDRHGYRGVHVVRLTHGAASLVVGRRPPAGEPAPPPAPATAAP
jgi:demethylmenaquinone methyltransferase/2-methoxy-6-polyprenyl-1,4-benzoquinol methylase